MGTAAPNDGTPKIIGDICGGHGECRGCEPRTVENTENIGHTTAKNKTTGLEETPNMEETLGGKGTDELRPSPKPEEATAPPDMSTEIMKALKSISPKNAPTRNETGDNVKSE